MSTGLPDAPNGGMNFLNAASRSGGKGHERQAVVHDRVRQQHAGTAGSRDDHDVVALGRRQDRKRAGELEHLAQRPRANHAGLPEHIVVDLVVAGERAGVRAGRLGAQGRASGLEHDDRLFLRHALGDFGEGAAVLQVLAVLHDDRACCRPARRTSADRPRRYPTCSPARRWPRRPSSPSGRSR